MALKSSSRDRSNDISTTLVVPELNVVDRQTEIINELSTRISATFRITPQPPSKLVVRELVVPRLKVIDRRMGIYDIFSFQLVSPTPFQWHQNHLRVVI